MEESPTKKRAAEPFDFEEESSSKRANVEEEVTLDYEKVSTSSIQQKDTKRKSWDERFDELQQYRREHGNCLVPQKYPLNPKLGRWVENQRSAYHRYLKEIQAGKVDPKYYGMCADRIARLEEVDFVWTVGRGGGKLRKGTVQQQPPSWHQRFQELSAYKDTHGDCIVPTIYPDNPALGRWVATQRKQYRKYVNAKETGTADQATGSGGMDEERVGLLEGIGFVWELGPGWDTNTWNERLEELKAYKQQHGDCNVPLTYTEKPQLAKWVAAQRTQYAKYMKDVRAGASEPAVGGIDADRIAKLEEIGFSWNVGRGRGQPKRTPEEEAELDPSSHGDTVAAQSSDSRKHAASSRAQADGPNYQVVLQNEWNQRICDLVAYKAEHGNLLVPTKYEKNPTLGRWVSQQRAQYHAYTKAKQEGNADLGSRRMNEERIAQLEAIGFVWAAKGHGGDDLNANLRWNQRFEELKAYKNEKGDCLVPTKYPKNTKLARWVGNQRQHYRLYMQAKEEGAVDPQAGGMNEERIQKLESIGFCWFARVDAMGEVWAARLKELASYRDEHGHCNVPRNYPQNQGLANWLSNQRNQYKIWKKNQESGDSDPEYTFMTADRVAQLEEVGMTWGTRKRRTKNFDAAPAAEAPPPVAPEPVVAQPAVVEERKEGDVWEL